MGVSSKSGLRLLKLFCYGAGVVAVLAVVAIVLVPMLAAIINGDPIWPPLFWQNGFKTALAGCMVDTSLGAWLTLTCDAGPVAGALGGVGGPSQAIAREITAFMAFHGGALECLQLASGVLHCDAGEASLNDHLARRGFDFGAPGSTGTHEAWIATLIGLAGAIGAFIYQYERTRKQARLLRELTVFQLNAFRQPVIDAVAQVIKTRRDKGPPHDAAQKALDGKIAEVREFLRLMSVPLSPGQIQIMTNALNQAANAAEIGENDGIRDALNKAFNKIEDALNGDG